MTYWVTKTIFSKTWISTGWHKVRQPSTESPQAGLSWLVSVGARALVIVEYIGVHKGD